MENAQLIGLSQQMALRRRMDVIANNIANLQTSGFRGESVVFEEYQMAKAEMNAPSRADSIISYVVDRASYRDHSAGTMRQTGSPLDVAIGGQGFFTVETPDGPAYTRDGGFQIDANGQLVTAAGYPVMSEGGPITFAADESGITFSADGTVSSSAGEKGRLAIVTVDDVSLLKAQGDNVFAAGDAVAQPAEDPRLMQGVLEGSNVSGVTQMTDMVSVNRTYQSIAKIIERTDELRRSTLSTLSRNS
ncbi:flagellar basal-body rod protein FlgF [Lutibaculum baratangense]|nr:flagellar basal-body rod protein FlgF [Lutibaculum baratangense]